MKQEDKVNISEADDKEEKTKDNANDNADDNNDEDNNDTDDDKNDEGVEIISVRVETDSDDEDKSDDGVNIDERVNDAAERIRNASSLSECDDAVATICERAGMLSDLNESADETVVLLKAANLLGVDVNGQWSADPEATELMNHIEFVNYTGAWPSLCCGILTLVIDGETVTFGPSTSVEKPMYDRFWRSGGYTNWATGEVVERGWCVCADELPEQYRAYADEIQDVMDANIPHGCCGGCL